ncbi:MAG: penicillin-binding protein 2 [Candidatus Omnitrophica bacterium]|nr:penicillin-binding protein 2 [Candidatus Omnitrophota bacterium]MDD5429388.1 penicillin-binding protein 2 [Candidatus Omnitrophota bacterium]
MIKRDRRTTLVYIVFACLFIIISFKIVSLQVFRGQFLKKMAQGQHYRLIRLAGKRGNIIDRKGRVLATDMHYYSVFADPFLVTNPLETARILSSKLDLSQELIFRRLKKQKRFVWIKRKISLAEKEKVEALKIEGVGFLREQKRFYPQEELAASVIGIVDIDGKGLEGLELFYDGYLSGKEGWARVLRDSSSREIVFSSQVITPATGADIVLSIDAQIQYWVEESLKKVSLDFDAKRAQAIVMNADNGQILAMANYPGFNSNDISGISFDNIKNRAVCDMFEPGSVFKVVTLIAAVNEKAFNNEDVFFCENGIFRIPGTVLHDWKPYGDLSFEEVFMKSSNIGVAKIVASLGPETYHRYLGRLGLGEITGVDFPGETPGSCKSFRAWSKTSASIVPIGQEVGVNLLQLVRVFAVVANGGYLVKPQLVTDICSRGFCDALEDFRKKIIPEDSAQRAKEILIKVVSEGTGLRAAIDGRAIGGKTGTAQKYDSKIGRYSPNRYRATFVGFVTDSNPPLVIGVTVDEPRKSHFGGVVAAPVFKEIAQKIIKYTESSGM